MMVLPTAFRRPIQVGDEATPERVRGLDAVTAFGGHAGVVVDALDRGACVALLETDGKEIVDMLELQDK